MNRVIRVTLPLPPRELSPNARTHWARKAVTVRSYRFCAKVLAACSAPVAPGWDTATAAVTFFLPDRRRRDKDNLMASLKPAWDGIADAGVVTDDAGLTQLPPRLEVDRENPRVEITLTQAEP